MSKRRRREGVSRSKTAPLPRGARSRESLRRAAFLAVLLLIVSVAVLATHWPALSARATCFDDEQYWLENRLVQKPGWNSASRFFREILEPSTVGGYYQPLTMTSLMLDWALGARRDNPRPFHRTSLALHAVNTALVIVFLYIVFGNPWAAAMVGLLFGVHPMTVETIPWVGERKTLLATFFSLWCLIIYVLYVRKPNWKLHVVALGMFVLALLSKPTSTPLAVLLLLLDCWPFRRLSIRALLEKIPFFVIAGISAVITVISQARAATAVVMPQEHSPLHIPLTLCHNIVFYLCKIVWPANLTAHYPFPEPFDLSHPMVLSGIIGTALLLGGLLVSLRWTRALLVGWLFFFAAILPTMGLITFTNVIASDKYAYLPALGLLMILALGLSRLWDALGRVRRPMVSRVGVVVIVLLVGSLESRATRAYLVHWRDTEGLYRHMLSLAPRAASLHDYLGAQLHKQGRVEEAIAHFTTALQINPANDSAHNNLGVALADQGKLTEAVQHFAEAVRWAPEHATTGYSNLGRALARAGRLADAIGHYEKALELDPDCLDAHLGLGTVLGMQGELDQAAVRFREAIRVDAGYVEAHIALGRVLVAQDKLDEAISVYEAALRIAPEDSRAQTDLQKARAERAASGTP